MKKMQCSTEGCEEVEQVNDKCQSLRCWKCTAGLYPTETKDEPEQQSE